MKEIKPFGKKEGGATLVEYALIVALLSIAVAATVILVQGAIDDKFNDVVTCLNDPSAENCPGGG